LTDQAAFQQRWRASAGPAATAEGSSPIEVAGLHALQFFDRLSLWLCCAERTRPLDIDDPSGEMSRWAPRGGETIVVECVKFTAAELILTAPSVEIPRQTYASDADLRGAISAGKRVTLSWTLVAPTLVG
jgi:hypothetical protein